MLDHGLAAAEGAGHGGHAALGHREQGVDDPLAGDHGLRGGQLFLIGTAPAHGPALEHGELDLLAVLLQLGDGGDDVGLALEDPGELAGHAGGHHDLVGDDLRLLDGAQHVAAGELVAHLGHGGEAPQLLVVQGVHHDAARDPVPRLLPDLGEGALDAVVDGLDEARAQLHGQRRAGGEHGLAGADAAGLLVDLDGGAVISQLDDLAYQLLFGHADHVEHLHVRHAACHDEGP